MEPAPLLKFFARATAHRDVTMRRRELRESSKAESVPADAHAPQGVRRAAGAFEARDFLRDIRSVSAS
jgi:hypothetical protein